MFESGRGRADSPRFAALCALLSGCFEIPEAPEVQPAPGAEGATASPAAELGSDAERCEALVVVGHRTLMGTSCRPLFDPERTPRVLEGDFEVTLLPSAAATSVAEPARLELRSAEGAVCHRPAAVWGGPDHIETSSVARRLREAGRPRAALDHIETHLEGIEDWDRLWILSEQARALANLDRIDEAMAVLEEAYALALDLELATEAARVALSTSYYALKRHRSRIGLTWVERAEEAISACPDPAIAAWVDYHRALLHEQLGDYRRARDGFERAALGLERLGETARAAAMPRFALAGQYWKLGQYERALSSFAALEATESKHPNPIFRAAFWNDVAELYLEARPDVPQALDQAHAWLHRALAEWKKLDRREGQAVSTFNLARVARRRGDLDSAWRHLAEARKLSPSPDGLSGRARDLFEAELYLESSQPTEAVERFRSVLEREARTGRGGPSEWTWRAHHGLARVFRRSGDLEAARQALDTALEHRRITASRAALRDQQASLLANTDDVFGDAVEVSLELDDVARAFTIADAQLAELMGAIDTPLRVSRLSDPQREEWQRRIDAYRRASAAFEAERSRGADLSAKARRAWAAKRRARRLELARVFDGHFAWLDEAAPPVGLGIESVEALRRRLDDDEALLSVVRFGDHIIAFWIDAERLDVHRPAKAENALAPWEDRLDAIRHLYLVGREAETGNLPFRPMANGHVLYEAASVAFLPYAGAVEVPETVSRGGAVVVADPTGDLPHARTEGQMAADELNATELIVGAEATRERVLDALTTASALHFAGHGVLTPSEPWDAHLQLADDQRLTLDDVLVRRLPLRLVVLSGCETGRPSRLSERDGIGLADAFLAAGSRAVLATSRRIRDEDATRFVKRFLAHEAFRQPAEALRRAALQDRAEGGETWKAFRLVGRR